MRHDWIEPLGLTITEAAEALGVTRQTLNNLVNGKSGISADMAIRLDKAFGGGAETWLWLQMAYDLAQARESDGIGFFPNACIAPVSPVLSGREQAFTNSLIEEALTRFTAADARDSKPRLWQLRGRYLEVLRSGVAFG